MAEEGGLNFTFAEKSNVGRQGSSTDFNLIDFEESRKDYLHYLHAAHGMIYAKNDQIIWNRYPLLANVMMQARFDGCIGFPGGLLDKDVKEKVHDALNRELEEEIGLDVNVMKFAQTDHVFSHINNKNKLVTHFYAKECDVGTYNQLEKNILNAEEWGIETFGTLRAPLFIMEDGQRGLPVFLANRFAGNAKDQMIHTLRVRKVVPDEHLDRALAVSEDLLKQQSC